MYIFSLIVEEEIASPAFKCEGLELVVAGVKRARESDVGQCLYEKPAAVRLCHSLLPYTLMITIFSRKTVWRLIHGYCL